jgi:hypothetical protein
VGNRKSRIENSHTWRSRGQKIQKVKKDKRNQKTQYFFAKRGGGCGGWAGPVTLLGRSPGVTQAT